MFWVQVFIWCGLVSLGSQFLFIGLRVRFDRSFAWFGISLLLLAAGLWTEVWNLPGAARTEAHLGALALVRLSALASFPALIRFFFHVTGVFPSRVFTPFLAWTGVAAVGVCMATLVDAAPGWSALVLLGSLAVFLVLSGRSLGAKIASERGAVRLRFLLLALGGLGVAIPILGEAVAALATMLLPERSFGPPSYGMPAVLGAGFFAVAGVHLLTQRFLSLYRADRRTMARLRNAYTELGEVAKLGELGVSAASISHEIRNYVATLKGNALLLKRDLDKADRSREVERIQFTAERMEAVSRDIALYARTSLPLAKRSVVLEALAKDCIQRHFPDREAVFRIHSVGDSALLEADADGMEQVFINLFKNALEAGAVRIDVRTRLWGDRLVLAVEDDGAGFPPEDLDRLSIPFFTGKSVGGTGLGCAISRAILEAHAATLRSYSKNALGGGSGLVQNLVFTVPERKDRGAWPGELLVVSEDPGMRNNIILPMIHLGLRPIVLPSTEALREWGKGGERNPVFLDHAVAGRLLQHGHPAAVVVDGHRKAIVTGRTGAGLPRAWERREAFLFSEENLAGLFPEAASA